MDSRTNLKSKRILRAGIGIAITLICVMGFLHSPLYDLVDMFVDPDPFDDRGFNRNVWLEHQANAGLSNPRGRMAYSIQAILIDSDMSLPEVIDLLGPPEISNEPYSIHYLLGAWSSIRIDPDYLSIRFDDTGRIVDVRIVSR